MYTINVFFRKSLKELKLDFDRLLKRAHIDKANATGNLSLVSVDSSTENYSNVNINDPVDVI